MNIRLRDSRGVALVIVLAFVVLITILVVGLTEAMRIDRPAAKSYLEKAQASQFAQMGVDSVVATFRSHTGNATRNWIARPGELIVGGTTNATALILSNSSVLLSSGNSSYGGASALTGNETVFNPPNLNVPTFRNSGSCLITDLPDASGTVVKIQPKWIYVLKDGNLTTSEKPSTTDKANPIVGRYAYWSDDESSRVNYNIAWGRSPSNTNPDGHLSKVDLTALQTPPSALDATAADALRSFLLNNSASGSLMPTGANYYFFNTPEDARRVTPASAALQAHRFQVTHYNHDPDTTFFNEPRIVLTTRPDRAGWTFTDGQWVGKNGLSGANGLPQYIRILTNEGTSNDPLSLPGAASDPGTMANLDTVGGGKVNQTINLLMKYLSRTDWPMISGNGSIQSKYYTKSNGTNYPAAYTTNRLAQLAVNIIDYVRSKESKLDLVEPMRTSQDPANSLLFLSGTNSPKNSTGFYGPLAYMGQTRAPKITEIGCSMAANNIGRTWRIELYLPRNYGILNIPMNLLSLSTQYTRAGDSNSNLDDATLTGNALSTASSATTLSAGNYVTVTMSGNYAAALTNGGSTINATTGVNVNFTAGAPRPSWVDARVYISSANATSTLYNAAPLSIGGKASFYYTANNTVPMNLGGIASTEKNTWVHVPIDPAPAVINSVQVDDPRLNMAQGNWIIGANTFGAANFNSSLNSPVGPTVPTDEPQQDTDAAGNISTDSLYMPPPAGRKFTLSSGVVDDNTLGMVLSAGELGYIHTGIESSSYAFNPPLYLTVNATFPRGVPWRTLRLQPNRDAKTVVPDWAFIDLFTAPVLAPTGAESVYSPGANTMGRAKTVGGRVNLNGKPTFPTIARIQPLAAVLQNSTYTSTSNASLTAAQATTLAGNIYNGTLANGAPVGKQYGYPEGYDSPGEIVEIKGIADQGEASEELVRKIANLITTRGNVFSVYSVGQALKQTPDGRLIVLGEQRLQAMIERIDYTEAGVKKVRFSPVYYRSLTP